MWHRLLAVVGFGALLATCAVWDTGSERKTEPPCECGVAPRCGQSCTASCGCCGVGQSACSPEGIIRADLSRNCYDLVPCSTLNRCVAAIDGPTCAESAKDCEAVRSAYEVELQRGHPMIARTGSEPFAAGFYPKIQCPESCKVSQGHCAQGLDTCWLVSYGPDPELDRLATLYEALGCPPLGVCNCPRAPEASCQFDSSGAAGAYRGPLTCMIH